MCVVARRARGAGRRRVAWARVWGRVGRPRALRRAVSYRRNDGAAQRCAAVLSLSAAARARRLTLCVLSTRRVYVCVRTGGRGRGARARVVHRLHAAAACRSMAPREALRGLRCARVLWWTTWDRSVSAGVLKKRRLHDDYAVVTGAPCRNIGNHFPLRAQPLWGTHVGVPGHNCESVDGGTRSENANSRPCSISMQAAAAAAPPAAASGPAALIGAEAAPSDMTVNNERKRTCQSLELRCHGGEN